MVANDGATTLRLYAGSSKGAPVYEEVVVVALGGERFKLLQSPGLVLGVAAGDTFEVFGDARVKVLSRGANLCIQIYPSGDELEVCLRAHLEPLQGRLDGKSDRQLVFTVPVSAGFDAIEAALAAVAAQFPAMEWFYGNVYEEDGVTPLNWW